MLTIKQRELLDYLSEYKDKHNHSPSYDEIRIAMRLKSKSGIHRIVSALEERGFIKKLANRARAIEIIRPINEYNQKILNNSSTVEIPLYGKIAAGTPIEAIANIEKTIPVPNNFIGNGSYYALEVSGDSMINKGIMDNDIAIIEKRNSAENGKIVVALIRKEEATLKILSYNEKKIILEPANKNYKSQIYTQNEVEIQGILVGIIRKY
jgi:repressor LexA